MKKVIRLTENQIEKAINEISYGKVDMAHNKLDDVFTDMEYAFNEFYETIKYNTDTNNPYVKKIKEYADKIENILRRKDSQRDNMYDELNKFNHKEFYDDVNRHENEEDYENLDLKYLQNKYPKDI